MEGPRVTSEEAQDPFEHLTHSVSSEVQSLSRERGTRAVLGDLPYSTVGRP